MESKVMIFGLFRGKNNARMIDRLHAEVVAAAREPVLFTSYGIADNLDGRFESLALHAALVLRRLKDLQAPGPDVAQDVADAVFRYFDIGLREVGISDTGVPRRMRDLAEAFLGRAAAYHDALRQTGDARFAALSEALSRNVFGGREDGAELARYVTILDKSLEQMPLVQFLEGPIFPVKVAAAAKEVP
jgi:cytochrome b pre-mRNA-processing protein 3